ncbi:C4-dicarboxylate ABC transporter substrate-binding protein [Brevibacterium litoralis]|uniref:C4-dicarboxylate ABC transporter substrate-binding protein n=1 Tax=Brevibacterium litoralis TaxID=3138935 RepID=UPI0032EC7211
MTRGTTPPSHPRTRRPAPTPSRARARTDEGRSRTRLRTLGPVAAAAVGALALTACAGGAGGGGGGGEGGGEGFEYGASQEEVDAVLADLEPVTLTYQPAAPSETSTSGPAALMFADYIEERSGGKITVDIVWAQAIAGYTEVDDALVDGRLDLAFSIPAYSPQEYPEFDGLMAYSQFSPTSVLTGELVTSAMLQELAWEQDDVIGGFEEKGLTVLSSMVSGGEYYMMCGPDHTGVEMDHWQGRSIRAGSTMNELVIQGVNGNPVSVQYTEAFEALQRNTIDCAFVQFAAATNFGLPEVAPNISYLTDSAIAGKATNTHLAGTSFQDLPLAYQQIIFDAEPYHWAGYQHHAVDSKRLGVAMSEEAGGEIQPLPDDVQTAMIEAQQQAVVDEVNKGTVGEDVEARAVELAEKWSTVPGELGFEDGGDLLDIADWYTGGPEDLLPYAERLYEEVTVNHRPA